MAKSSRNPKGSPRPLASSWRLLVILVGLISGVIGLGLFIFFTIGTMGAFPLATQTDPPFLILFIIMFGALVAGAGAFMTFVSYKLLGKRGSIAEGELLSPGGWRMLGCILFGIFAMLAGIGWQLGKTEVEFWGASILAGTVFATYCFAMASGWGSE